MTVEPDPDRWDRPSPGEPAGERAVATPGAADHQDAAVRLASGHSGAPRSARRDRRDATRPWQGRHDAGRHRPNAGRSAPSRPACPANLDELDRLLLTVTKPRVVQRDGASPCRGSSRPDSSLSKCHRVETDRGGHTVRRMTNAQIPASQNAIDSATLQIRCAPQAHRGSRSTTPLSAERAGARSGIVVAAAQARPPGRRRSPSGVGRAVVVPAAQPVEPLSPALRRCRWGVPTG